MDNFKVQGKVLENKSGQFMDAAKGTLVVYSQCLAEIGGKVLKLKCSKDVDVAAAVGREVEFEFEFRAGKDLLAEVRVVAIDA